MINTRRVIAFASIAGVLASATGCKDFLTAGEAGNDPNRPTIASANRLFVGVMGNIWAQQSSGPVRIAGLYTQQFEGTNGQFTNIYQYGISESTTDGFYSGLYTSGGLVDVRELERQVTAANDKRYLGIAQVQEAILIGTGADLFGDIVYTQALKGTSNPALDPQLAVYDSVQALLSRAIVNLADNSPTSAGPGSNDLSYGGSASKYIKLAHTLKARFYLHTAEVRPASYGLALAESRLGIMNTADNFNAVFSGNANEQNYQYQFSVDQRPGYYTPNTFFVNLLKSRSDPRLTDYFNSDQSDISDARLTPNYAQPLFTANENLLIEAEAAYRTGATAEAVSALNAERALTPGLGAVSAANSSGLNLLREILTEKYIALFGTLEIYNDYKRTCFPNITPVTPGKKVPARLLYDTSERNTNTSIPDAALQPTRNANDPANATDPFGATCLGQ